LLRANSHLDAEGHVSTRHGWAAGKAARSTSSNSQAPPRPRRRRARSRSARAWASSRRQELIAPARHSTRRW